MLIDSHCHLHLSPLREKIDSVISRAEANNVRVLQMVSITISRFQSLLSIANKYKNVFCSVGEHPLNVGKKNTITYERLISLSNNNKVTAIGETGLDYSLKEDSAMLQQDVFIKHIYAAQETGLPLIIHSRNADIDMVKILRSEMKKKTFTAVIHCFTSSRRMAYECLDMGFYISASGIVTFKNAKDLQTLFQTIPKNKILIETDSPYLSPVPFRGTINEPANLIYTAKFLAKLLNISDKELYEITSKNYYSLFNKAEYY